MHLISNPDKRITVAVSEDEARHMLDGLKRHAGELGDEAAALRAKLEEAGLAPPPPPDHIRHEWEGDPP
ncbi:hypothetical protein HUS23_10975 [Ectothiorhodospiraceae bacterium 2226]|nr:hypothetical protein HUS23_10975 [Ectothiorhodospiraceae bacterium 2226]